MNKKGRQQKNTIFDPQKSSLLLKLLDKNSPRVRTEKSDKPKEEVRTQYIDLKKYCKIDQYRWKKYKFQSGNVKYCEICAVQKAYCGIPLQHIESGIQFYQTNQIPLAMNYPDENLQMREKRTKLFEFIKRLDRTNQIIQDNVRSVTLLIEKGMKEYVNDCCVLMMQELRRVIKENEGKLQYSPSICKQQVSLFSAYSEDISCMKKDIEINLENIIKTMKLQPFYEIIQKYQLKLEQYELSFKDGYAKIIKVGMIDFMSLKQKLIEHLIDQLNIFGKQYSFEQPQQNHDKFYKVLDKVNTNQKIKFDFLHKFLKSEPMDDETLKNHKVL